MQKISQSQINCSQFDFDVDFFSVMGFEVSEMQFLHE